MERIWTWYKKDEMTLFGYYADSVSSNVEFSLNGIIIPAGTRIYKPWDGIFSFGSDINYWINHVQVSKNEYYRMKSKLYAVFY